MSEFGKDINVPSRKGVFIPDITVEMLRNASLEGVEDLLASGEMEDISLPSAQPEPITVNIDHELTQEEYEKLHKDMENAPIMLLPSAQPEQRCEYYALCRHGRGENKLRARVGFCEYCNEDSDGYVKPIEKNGHAFVRFGMNGWELSLKANGWHGGAKIRYCPMCGRDLLAK